MYHPSNISDLQKQSGAIAYAGCVGKTSLQTTDPLYRLTVHLAEILVSNGIGILHGGYEDGRGGGTMQAYAEGAYNIIKQNNLNPHYNIGIPENRFDKKRGIQDRTKFETQFTDPLGHMDLRCGVLIDACDFLVVNPVAGNGTLREVFTMYERNDIHRPGNLGTGKISPIIFYGDNRKELFAVLNNSFATGVKVDEDENLFFVNSLTAFEETVHIIKSKLSS